MIETHDPSARGTGAVAPAPSAAADGVAHPFAGRHLVVSYLGCDLAALSNHRGLVSAMGAGVKASGAHLLKTSEHAFSEGGFTAVMLLSESHASVHTYPEFAACFVDLFTCGYACKAEKFDEVLRAYLRPQEVAFKTFLRSNDVVDAVVPTTSQSSESGASE
jgi:S-adenosylmethionine decarboxylase